jgi:hypothetical protein
MEVARIAWYDWPSLSIDPAGHFTHASFTRANRRRRSKGTEFSGAKLKLHGFLAKLESRFLSMRIYLLSPSILSAFDEASRRGAGRRAHLCLVNMVSMPDGDVFNNDINMLFHKSTTRLCSEQS